MKYVVHRTNNQIKAELLKAALWPGRECVASLKKVAAVTPEPTVGGNFRISFFKRRLLIF